MFCCHILHRTNKTINNYLKRSRYEYRKNSRIKKRVGSREKVNELTAKISADEYKILSGPRITGDGYYESCIIATEGILIELTE